MSSVYRPNVYKPLPPGAELFVRKGERFARWTTKRGRSQTARVAVPRRGKHAGQALLAVQSRMYWCKYRDADGLHRVPTECRAGLYRSLSAGRAEAVRRLLQADPP